MLFKMMIDNAAEDERPIVRSLLKHIVGGIAAGIAVGAALMCLMLFAMRGLNIEIPSIFIIVALLQFGPAGGLAGAALYVSRAADRSSGHDKDDDEPGGGTRAPVTPLRLRRLRPARIAPAALPAPA